jgi:energy-coupling factor transporter ATP-binding protein EcfA2
MKRITKLEISNFRAFFDSYEIELEKGENLLIYGENGSGKSSLFKSLIDFLSSSQNAVVPYIKHQSKNTEDGILSFTFNEYDIATNSITSKFGQIISFGSNLATTSTEQFIKTAELTKGFLDYKGLLAVYNHNEAQPNLFDLIILNLFKDFIPTHLGGIHPLGNRCNQLYKMVTKAYNRNTYDYRDGVPEMANYEALLRNVLDEVFQQLNDFLDTYFDLDLNVGYKLKPLVAIGWWREIPTELKLEIRLSGRLVPHQSDFLNEARLSALAICLYLAIIKKNPQLIEFKVLFLDDVFIGLDLTNRLPILDIIKNEFSDYQIFLSTYDRHLYELAKRKFEIETPEKWKSIELYVGKDQIGTQPVDRPILVVGESHLEKAVQYLHDRRKPDYPAAANYFRKALEQIILEEVPAYEKADIESKIQILDYKLGPLIYKTKRFLERWSQSTATIDRIITLLPSLLHPLSHHEITSPVYKGELLQIENLIPRLSDELKALDCLHKLKCSPLEGRNVITIKYTIDNATNHFGFYYLRTSEPILLINDGTGVITMSDTKCFIEKCYGENNGIEVPHSRKNFTNDEKAHPDNNFKSIQEAYNTIYGRMIQIPAIGNFPMDVNYLDAVQYLDQQGNYQSLNSIIVW